MGQATEVMRRKFAAFNAQDIEEMVKHFSPEAQKDIPGATLRGRNQIAGFVSAFWEAFPDIQLTVTNVVEEGPVVAVRGRITGTHLGTLSTPGGDIPATGRALDLPFSDEYEIQGCVIVSSHLHFDRLSLLEQLGVAPTPAAA